MKNMYSLLFLMGISSTGFSQLSENFDSGLPAGWTQSGSFTWVANATQGTNGSGCVMVDQGSTGNSGNAMLETTFLDLTLQNDPELTFNGATIRSNFMNAGFNVWYDTGSGWVSLSTVDGVGGVDDTVGTADFAPPLDNENISWVPITISLESIASSNHVRIAIEADFPNGGWLLMDDFAIEGTGSTAGLTNQENLQDIFVYPNPVRNELFISGDLSTTEVRIHEMNGKVIEVIREFSPGSSIGTDHLMAGTYFLTVTTEKGNVYLPFCVE